MLTSSATPSTSVMLDRTPPSPPDRMARTRSRPGDDTMAMQGGMSPDDLGDGSPLSTPGARAIAAVGAMMQAANTLQGVFGPGVIPEPVLMGIQQLMTVVPQLVQQMTQGGGMGLLNSLGSPAPGAMTAGAPIGLAAMGAPMGGQPMGMEGMPPQL